MRRPIYIVVALLLLAWAVPRMMIQNGIRKSMTASERLFASYALSEAHTFTSGSLERVIALAYRVESIEREGVGLDRSLIEIRGGQVTDSTSALEGIDESLVAEVGIYTYFGVRYSAVQVNASSVLRIHTTGSN